MIVEPPAEPNRSTTPTTLDKANPASRLIVALDLPSSEIALDMADQLQGLCRWFKVGMELYYAAGNPVISRLRERGFEVFLDLKLHDIPNTVAGAVRSVSTAGASLLTLHAGGGRRMMQAAVEAADRPNAPKLLAVSVLTSMDEAELRGVGVVDASSEDGGMVQAQVLRLARLAQSAGVHGLVCSPQEVAAVRAVMGPEATLVIPGIRPAGTEGRDDQSRVATPASAIRDGASMLVVGRPITQAADPARAAELILNEIRAADLPA